MLYAFGFGLVVVWMLAAIGMYSVGGYGWTLLILAIVLIVLGILLQPVGIDFDKPR
jgi:hypothetical protein